MKTLISLFALVMFAAVSIASDCRQRVVVHHQQAQVVQHAAVQQYAVQHVQNYAAAYVAQYVAVPLVIPAYTVSYTKDSSDELSKLREELKAIREALKTQPVPPTQPADGPITVPLTQRKQAQAAPDHDGAKILVVSCSKCHDASNAKNKGGGFTLTSGASLAPLNDSQTLAVVREIYSGRMPKGSKLTDADVGAVIEWIDTRK